ncbi:hypothetical protein GCM10022278_35100 [Allohahella marinimesophila]|uniref:Uncharacterized protein n=1 Tax=Allohahella marinimesophila TaxID=1054972 RepID=A0ABP7Q1R3_9GAMM
MVQPGRERKVAQFQLQTVWIDQNVAWLDIAMDDLMPMYFAQRFDKFNGDLQPVANRERPLLHELRKRYGRKIFENQNVDIILMLEGVCPNDTIGLDRLQYLELVLPASVRMGGGIFTGLKLDDDVVLRRTMMCRLSTHDGRVVPGIQHIFYRES